MVHCEWAVGVGDDVRSWRNNFHGLVRLERLAVSEVELQPTAQLDVDDAHRFSAGLDASGRGAMMFRDYGLVHAFST